MTGPISAFLEDDHRRLDALLDRAATGAWDPAAYSEFRSGLLKHIGMEERILLPAVKRLQGGRPHPLAADLRLQHGAIAALLVPTPTPDVVATLREVLRLHNPLEEGPGALYETSEAVLGEEGEALLVQLRDAPEVPVAAHVDGPKVLAAMRRALERAGFRVEDLPLSRSE